MTMFGETPRSTKPKARPNDLSDQAAMSIAMGSAVLKVRTAVEAGTEVKLTNAEARLILIAIREALTRAKMADKAARDANERARRARRR